jgi:hypothetical protein
VAVDRRSSPALDRLGVDVHAGIDLTSDASVAKLATALANERPFTPPPALAPRLRSAS